MKARFICSVAFGFAVCAAACLPSFAQDAPATAPAGQTPPASQPQGQGQGQRSGGRGGWGGGGGMGRPLMGTVTEATADHYTVKTDSGDVYTVHFSANTRIMKQAAGMRGPGGAGGRGEGGGGERGQNAGAGGGGGMGNGGNPPQTIKATDIKVGDAIAAMGEVDAAAKSVGAVAIFQIDPERVKQMREMQANYGKTWLAGKVTAIDGVKVTIMGSTDNAAHSFVADENTTFRKRRDPITLADIQVGDNVRVEGAVKDGAFLATSVNAMSPQAAQGSVPRAPQAPPQ